MEIVPSKHMDEQTLTCVYCGQPIWVGAPFVNILGGIMHPDCASDFEIEWEGHRQMAEMNQGVDNEPFPD